MFISLSKKQHKPKPSTGIVAEVGFCYTKSPMITQTELHELLKSIETYRVERTTSTGVPQDVPQGVTQDDTQDDTQDGTQGDTQGINHQTLSL